MAETASAMLPYAVMITTGSEGSASTAVRSTSIPVPDGSLRSVSTAEKCCLRSAAIASSAVPVESTAYCMRCSALVSISRSSNLSSTSSMDSMRVKSPGIVLWVLTGETAKRKALLPQGHGILVSNLLGSRGAHAGFPCLLLQIIKLLASIVERLFFRRRLVVVLALGRSPGCGIAKLVARVRVVSGLAQLPFSGGDIELAFQPADLALLRFDIHLDLVRFFLLRRRIGRGRRSSRSRLRSLIRSSRRWRGRRSQNRNGSRSGQIVVGEHLGLRCRRFFGARFTRGIAKRLRVSRERQCAGYSDSS